MFAVKVKKPGASSDHLDILPDTRTGRSAVWVGGHGDATAWGRRTAIVSTDAGSRTAAVTNKTLAAV